MKQETGKSREVNIDKKLIQYFLVVEIGLYLTFLILDSVNQRNGLSNILKFISISLCFIFVFYSFVKNKEKYIFIMLLILFFTVIADIFLLFTSRFEIGIVSFVIVQCLYFYKLKLMNHGKCKRCMVEVLTIAFIWNMLVLIMKNKNFLSPFIVIASLYFIIFTANLVKSWVIVMRDKSRNIYEVSFAIGLVLFYICDINVGLSNLNIMAIDMPKIIELLARNSALLMWVFYLPAQVILSINGVLYKGK